MTVQYDPSLFDGHVIGISLDCRIDWVWVEDSVEGMC